MPSATADRLITFGAELGIALNHINRSMGLADIYPFVLTPKIREKLAFVHARMHAARPERRARRLTLSVAGEFRRRLGDGGIVEDDRVADLNASMYCLASVSSSFISHMARPRFGPQAIAP